MIRTISITSLVTFLILSVVLTSCRLESRELDLCVEIPRSESTINILTIGDSRVVGNPPNFESYRYHLWRNFIINQWDVNFIGTRVDNRIYSSFKGFCFDNEHEGEGGATTTSMISRLKSIELSESPQLALIGIGGNDLLSGRLTLDQVIKNIKVIIREIREENPTSIIFIEQIAPGQTSFMTPELQDKLIGFNKEILLLSKSLNNSEKPVIAIDMATGWDDSLLADDVHYNDQGAKFVADRYYLAILNHYSNYQLN